MSGRLRRWFAACFGAALLVVVGAAPSATAAEPANGNFECRYGAELDGYDWSYVANVPGGYVIGNCYDGWHLHRTFRSEPTGQDDLRWDGGMVLGNFTGCGWVRQDMDAQVGAGTYGPCSTSASRPPRDFALRVNCAPTRCSDGTRVTNTETCRMHLNLRPWSQNGAPANFARDIPPSEGRLLWRYVTKYPYNGEHWVLVRDAGTARGQGNWGFVPFGCVPYLPPGEGGYWDP